MSYIPGKSLIKIAVAEDHAMLRDAMCKMIDSWSNCKVILEADSGIQLINQIDPENLPDLALVDLAMPGMNGYETIRLLAKTFPEIKTIIVSMYIGEEAISQALQAGAHGFLHKSEDSGKLKAAVYETMRTGYYFTDRSAARMVKQSQHGQKIKKSLTDEEITFLKNIVTEKTYKQIALDMAIAPRHVEHLRNSLFERFEVQNRTSLAVQAIEKGLVV